MRKRSGTRQHGYILLFAKNNRNLNRYRRRCYSISSRISMNKWSDTIQKIANRHSKKMKRKNNDIPNKIRTLMKIKRNIKIEQKQTRNKSKISSLITRRKLVNEYIYDEIEKNNKNKVNKVVTTLEKSGGINSNKFWDIRKKLQRHNTENKTAIIDKDGITRESTKEIIEVYEEFYKKLLTTPESLTEEEREIEKIVEKTISCMESIAEISNAAKVEENEVKEIVNELKIKKAKDCDGWNNELIKEGEEMIKSITKMFNRINDENRIPEKWKQMKIKSIHKKGSNLLMGNKRGLFITNVISKVYEKILKKRNSINGISWFQCGGQKNRSTIDHVMTRMAIIDKQKFLNKKTYLVFLDAEKCFDKLWLKACVIEMWKAGHCIQDSAMVYKLNKEANVVIETPVGTSKEIEINEVVRQGTIYGPQLCCISTDKVNNMLNKPSYIYSSNINIEALTYVDDIASAGGSGIIIRTIQNCHEMERKKKFTFNVTKSNYMVMNTGKDIEIKITEEVKNGQLQKVKEYKYLGVWINEGNNFVTNIRKIKEKIPFMIATIKKFANNNTIGKYTIISRLKLYELVIIPTITYNIEAWTDLQKMEIEELEKIQGRALRSLLEVPKSTPYLGIIFETGIWLMKNRIEYKKLLLIHQIITSDDNRLIRKIIEDQDNSYYHNWYTSVKRIAEKYILNVNMNELQNHSKNDWKVKVKVAMEVKIKEEIKEKSKSMTKLRNVIREDIGMKGYITEMNQYEVTGYLKLRLHMYQLKSNYKNNNDDDSKCPLCKQNEDTT